MLFNDQNRFIKLDEASNPLPRAATAWAQTQDPATGLIWASRYLDGRFKWAPAQAAAAECRLAGLDTWRCPAPNEGLTIVDFSHFGPAVNTDFFQIDSDWIWTSSVGAEYPRDGAWGVDLYGGYASRDGQGSQGRVLVVRSAPLPRQ